MAQEQERPRVPIPVTPLTEDNPLAQMLRRIGVQGPLSGQAPSVNDATGAYVTGPNPMITAPFRGLFNQGQIDAYALRTPMQITTLSKDGKYSSKDYNWWDPNASLDKAISGLNGGQHSDPRIPGGVPWNEGMYTRGTDGKYYLFKGGKWVETQPRG